jgi:Arc/MetJ family transcription regulator
MRKHTTIDLDMDLVREAGSVLGTTRTTDTVHAALAQAVNLRRRLSLLDIDTDLDLEGLRAIRAHRFAERKAAYGAGEET